MDQERIGKFIAQCRKEKKLTQQELADKLGVSDRTVGNWENGRNMPDLSLFKPLCEELNISMNDFLSGERIKEEEYPKKSEENIVNTIAYTNNRIHQSKRIFFRVLLVSGIIFLFLGAIVIFVFKDNQEKKKSLESYEKKIEDREDAFYYGIAIGDGRQLNLQLDALYCQENICQTLGDVFLNNELTVDKFVKELDLLEYLKDGDSIIYYYDKNKKIYGPENFYVAVCNSEIKDIFIARNKKSLDGKCTVKFDDLEGVSMRIKEGTLTSTGATVIIRDTSNRDNIYGAYYRIEKRENNKWIELQTLPQENGAEIGFISIGYTIDRTTHEREFAIDWNCIYGELPKGEYRIVKDTSEPGEGTEHYITAEFILK